MSDIVRAFSIMLFYENIGDGIQLEQARIAAGYNAGMRNAYGNVGDGLKAEQARKAAGYSKGMNHAYGNIGDGLKAEQERKALDANRAYYNSFKPDVKPEDGENGAGGNPFGESFYFDKDGSRVRGEKPIIPTQSLLDDMFNAGGKGMPEDGEKGPGSASYAIEVLDNTRKNISTSQREDVDLVIEKINNGEIKLDHKTVIIESDWDVFNAQVASEIDTIFPALAIGAVTLPYTLPIAGATAASIVPALVASGVSIGELIITAKGLPDVERGTYDEYTADYVDGNTNVNIVFRKYRDEPYGVSAYDDFVVSRIPRTENWDDYGL